MRISKNLIIAGVCFVAAVGLLTLTFTREHKPVKVEVAQTDSSFNNYVETLELQNSLDRDAQAEAEKRAKLAKSKKESVECQFWTGQNASNPSKRAAEKIIQFCELSSSAQSESSSQESVPAK